LVEFCGRESFLQFRFGITAVTARNSRLSAYNPHISSHKHSS